MAPTIGRVALDNGFHGSIPGDWVAPPPQNIHHLIGFPRGSLISASPVSLRGNELTLGRDKIPVISDISFYGC